MKYILILYIFMFFLTKYFLKKEMRKDTRWVTLPDGSFYLDQIDLLELYFFSILWIIPVMVLVIIIFEYIYIKKIN